MKEHEVKMVFDLTNPEEANIYNTIRSLDNIKNALSEFKSALKDEKDAWHKIEGEENYRTEVRAEIERLSAIFESSFKRNGITV